VYCKFLELGFSVKLGLVLECVCPHYCSNFFGSSIVVSVWCIIPTTATPKLVYSDRKKKKKKKKKKKEKKRESNSTSVVEFGSKCFLNIR
jgi:hypothetical protein